MDFDYWTESMRADGVPFPRFYDWFGDDEIGQREAKEICLKHGIELRYFTDDMPACMIEENESLEAKHLGMIGRPDYDGKDGWKLVGAFDTEDGEIVLMYARPAKVRESEACLPDTGERK